MKILEKINPLIKLSLTNIDESEYNQNNVECVDGILYFNYENQNYRLHSIKKEEEAKLLMKGLDKNRDYLITLFGMGNISLLQKICTETSPGTRIMVFEPNVLVFQYMITNFDFTNIVLSKKIVFTLGKKENIDRTINAYLGQNWDNLIHNIKVISLPNYHVYKSFRMECIQTISSKVTSELLAIGNSLEDTLFGFSQNYQNVDACIRANSLQEIRNKYEGYPAIIVASGPSLDKNIADLKKAEGRALIITCDASLETCKANGVKPDVIASLERGELIYKYFYEGKKFDKELVLAGPPLMWPEIYTNFQGKMILVAKTDEGMEDWWAKNFNNQQFVATGHSCATMAFAVAKAAGCSPIILMGQDLGYTDEKIHGELAHPIFEGENSINKVEMELEDLWVEDVFGNMVRTSSVFNLFRYFFEIQILTFGLDVIDATEGGARIAGSRVMPLKEAIEQYCAKDIGFEFNSLLEEIHKELSDYIGKYEEIIHSGIKLKEKVNCAREMAVEFYGNIKQYEGINLDEVSEEELNHILMIMEKTNVLVGFIMEKEKDIKGFYHQLVKQTIMNVKRIGNEITPGNIRRNLELQLNFLYLVEIASLATMDKIDEMIDFLEEKIKEKINEKSTQ